jgi:hypothetical protein
MNSIQKDAHHNTTNIALIKSTNDDLKNKLESLDKQILTKNIKEINNSGIKGSINEDKLFNLLTDSLKPRDGYDITRVNGIAHSCDILVQKDNLPNVRIDSKAIGELNGHKVKTSDVEKFERDLLELNEHGILVSLFSGIVGKGSIEIKLLPNSKFAIYLSNNNYDIPFIIDMIYLIYKLDSFVTLPNSKSQLSLTPDKIILIQNIIKDSTSKIFSIKNHLKESINILNSITLDSIEKILLDIRNSKHNSNNTVIKCDNCDFLPKNHTGLIAHKRKCTKSKTIDID